MPFQLRQLYMYDATRRSVVGGSQQTNQAFEQDDNPLGISATLLPRFRQHNHHAQAPDTIDTITARGKEVKVCIRADIVEQMHNINLVNWQLIQDYYSSFHSSIENYRMRETICSPECEMELYNDYLELVQHLHANSLSFESLPLTYFASNPTLMKILSYMCTYYEIFCNFQSILCSPMRLYVKLDRQYLKRALAVADDADFRFADIQDIVQQKIASELNLIQLGCVQSARADIQQIFEEHHSQEDQSTDELIILQVDSRDRTRFAIDETSSRSVLLQPRDNILIEDVRVATAEDYNSSRIHNQRIPKHLVIECSHHSYAFGVQDSRQTIAEIPFNSMQLVIIDYRRKHGFFRRLIDGYNQYLVERKWVHEFIDRLTVITTEVWLKWLHNEVRNINIGNNSTIVDKMLVDLLENDFIRYTESEIHEMRYWKILKTYYQVQDYIRDTVFQYLWENSQIVNNDGKLQPICQAFSNTNNYEYYGTAEPNVLMAKWRGIVDRQYANSALISICTSNTALEAATDIVHQYDTKTGLFQPEFELKDDDGLTEDCIVHI